MQKPNPKRCPVGNERTSFNIPIRTMAFIRHEAEQEGCTLNHIAAKVLNGYARGEFRCGFIQPGEPTRKL